MQNSRIFSSYLPEKTAKTPQAVGKKTAAVSIAQILHLLSHGSPFAAWKVLFSFRMKLLPENQIINIPVLPYTAPDTIGLTLDHRHAVHLL